MILAVLAIKVLNYNKIDSSCLCYVEVTINVVNTVMIGECY